MEQGVVEERQDEEKTTQPSKMNKKTEIQNIMEVSKTIRFSGWNERTRENMHHRPIAIAISFPII